MALPGRTSSPQSSDQPSLQELSEKKVLGQILTSDHADSEFDGLEPHLRKALFSRLRKEHASLENQCTELKKACSSLRILEDYCPHTDIQIYLSGRRIEPAGGENDEDGEQQGQHGGEPNGYALRDAFRNQWSYYPDEYTQLPENGPQTRDDCPTVNWHTYSIGSDSKDSCLALGTTSTNPGLNSFSHSLFDKISSQLLLYRVMTTFDMPPPIETDGYKSAWHVDLFHQDGISTLALSDNKGAPSTRFSGTSGASVDALGLLNFLTGMNCPHTYDGIVAGTMA